MIDMELISTSLLAREKARLQAVIDLEDPSKHEDAMQVLLIIWMKDCKDWETGRGPSGIFADMDIDDLSRFCGKPESLRGIGEPWATRCAVWRADIDWDGFIKNWKERHDLPVRARLRSLTDDLTSRLLKEEAEKAGQYLFEEEYSGWIGGWSYERVLSDVTDLLKDFYDFCGTDSSGQPFSPMTLCDYSRERVRRAAIKDLDNDALRDKAISALRRVVFHDQDDPRRKLPERRIGKLRSQIRRAGEFVPDGLVDRVWAIRFNTWMSEENAQPSGYPASTWNEFIETWVAESDRVVKLLQSEHL